LLDSIIHRGFFVLYAQFGAVQPACGLAILLSHWNLHLS